MGIDPKAEQLRLVVHLCFAKQFYSIIGIDGFFPNRYCLFGNRPHAAFNLVQQLLSQCEGPLCPDKQGMADGILDGNALNILPANHIIEGFQHQKNHTAFISLHPRLFFCRNHFQRAIPIQSLVQFTEFPVSIDKQNIMRISFLKISSYRLIQSSFWINIFNAIHVHFHHSRIFHRTASSNSPHRFEIQQILSRRHVSTQYEKCGF